MNYAKDRAVEILDSLLRAGVIQTPNILTAEIAVIETIINHIIRDVRHKCAENINSELFQYPIKAVNAAHNVVMNTDMNN